MDEDIDDREFSGKNDPAASDSDFIKKKYFYRTLIVKGKARVKNALTTRRLVGPDCAYHLYSYMKNDDAETEASS